MIHRCRDCKNFDTDEFEEPCKSCDGIIDHSEGHTTFRLSKFEPNLSVAKNPSVSQVQPKGVTLSSCGLDQTEK
jgi:hypothetical protein